jgi:hypothetical protein
MKVISRKEDSHGWGRTNIVQQIGLCLFDVYWRGYKYEVIGSLYDVSDLPVVQYENALTAVQLYVDALETLAL